MVFKLDDLSALNCFLKVLAICCQLCEKLRKPLVPRHVPRWLRRYL